MISPILEARVEIQKCFHSFLVQMKTSKSHSEIKWSLGGALSLQTKLPPNLKIGKLPRPYLLIPKNFYSALSVFWVGHFDFFFFLYSHENQYLIIRPAAENQIEASCRNGFVTG